MNYKPYILDFIDQISDEKLLHHIYSILKHLSTFGQKENE